MTIVSRFAGVVFFLFFHSEYGVLGVFDLVFGLLQGFFLFLTFQIGPKGEGNVTSHGEEY
ncbi:MAG: hypothetical protein CMJ78_05955 [Planctomycetaceae bacterium]|nr:hypothetical protein [Planctomycetaceae bacterium]